MCVGACALWRVYAHMCGCEERTCVCVCVCEAQWDH